MTIGRARVLAVLAMSSHVGCAAEFEAPAGSDRGGGIGGVADIDPETGAALIRRASVSSSGTEAEGPANRNEAAGWTGEAALSDGRPIGSTVLYRGRRVEFRGVRGPASCGASAPDPLPE